LLLGASENYNYIFPEISKEKKMSKDLDNENPLVFEAEDMMSECEAQVRKQQEGDCQFEDPIDKYEGIYFFFLGN
jgi:hypothetical protein